MLIVASADHLYRCDFRDVLDTHAATGAEATVVSTEVDEDASRYAVVSVNSDHRVTRLDYKPEEPVSNVVAAELFAYQPDVLFSVLDELAATGPLGDYGERLLPALIERGRVHEFRLDGYWRDLGTIEAYFAAHMEMLESPPPFRLDDPGWAILSATITGRPAYFADAAVVRTSLVAHGCAISGTVERSILGPGVVVAEGASVRDAVLLAEVHVGTGATIERAIIDEGARVRPRQTVAGTGGEIAVWTG